ncbi:lytic murein transglycosylase [Psychrobacter lutiphocae]|uniref:lytic murein transglycosylase n=1 Tax=Psychrobacter lutiphocae TaxID=540500 RepID=UPI00037C2A3B|nr:lytic murein transglycosylase [Psychrobacter lutiphocae]
MQKQLANFQLKHGLALISALFLASCSTKPVQQVPVITPKPAPVIVIKPDTTPPVQQPAPQPAPVLQPKASYNSFEEWKSDFRARAINQGYNPYDISRIMDSAQLNNRVISLDSNQAEFVKMPWEYADSAVSGGRVSSGQSKFNQQRSLLSRLESQYGVNAEIIAAIWGMESSFGSFTGSSYIPSSLGTLAYEGRRREWAEEQLLALMKIIERGDVSPSQLKGSWAGGMGQTQFIPGTWLEHGVDGDGDGRRNPWATADALASTANYLSNSGWIRGVSPFYETTLPSTFDYHLLGQKMPASTWRSMGITANGGGYIDDHTLLELWLPAGKEGPALLLSPNFDVIKVYNNSSNYALGVSLLGRAIVGQSGIQKSWPRYEKPLTKGQVKNLQYNLTRAGYDTQGIDGIMGTNTRNAFARWQTDNGQIPDGFVTQRSANSLIW